MYVDVLTQVVPTVGCMDGTLPALPTAGENSGIKLCNLNNSEHSNGEKVHVAVPRIKIKCGLGRKRLTSYSTKLPLGVGLVVQFDHVTMFKVS